MGVVEVLQRFLKLIMSIVGFFPVMVYGFIYSQYFTKATYRLIGEQAKKNKNIKSVLDIGTATGHPLKSIIDSFENAEVLGIDIDTNYIPACQKLFKNYKNVTIREMNFYDLPKNYPDRMFDVIIFGSSLMLMPDQVRAMDVAKKQLNKGGKIYFMLTLYDTKTAFNSVFMEKIKPYLKYLTTVDFGKVTYMKEFHEFLKDHGLEVSHSERCGGNFLLKFFKFYIYETTVL